MVSLFFIDLELPIDPPYQPPWGILKGMFFWKPIPFYAFCNLFAFWRVGRFTVTPIWICDLLRKFYVSKKYLAILKVLK
jgi:hypothetical protein